MSLAEVDSLCEYELHSRWKSFLLRIEAEVLLVLAVLLSGSLITWPGRLELV
jgi:hypothetical protein